MDSGLALSVLPTGEPGLVSKLLLPHREGSAYWVLYLALEILQILCPDLVFPLKARSFLVAARGKAGLPRED